VSCQSGIALDNMLDDIWSKSVTRWATRKCYPYVGRPATGECSTIDIKCANGLPRGELHVQHMQQLQHSAVTTSYTDLCRPHQIFAPLMVSVQSVEANPMPTALLRASTAAASEHCQATAITFSAG
jgi:hypothetical protein